MTKRFALLGLLATSCAQSPVHPTASPVRTPANTKLVEMVELPPLSLKLRAGYTMEKGQLKGCVLYLQGLGDSIMNHEPYFSALNAAGYRILFFDYMGQGGSEGKMDDTRILIERPEGTTEASNKKYEEHDKYNEIPVQAELVWDRYSEVANDFGQNCKGSKKLVIGWSTGGLAAYRMAFEKRAHAVVLLAPGIHPRYMVGESAHRWDKMILLRQTITEPTLTRNRFPGGMNPHVDPIKPNTPLRVPKFAGNLIFGSTHARKWKIAPEVAGLVLLSGAEDSYVKRDATAKTIKQQAPHFEVKSFDHALHELDNELPEVAYEVQQSTIRFFDSVLAK